MNHSPQEVERRLKRLNARLVVVETSSRSEYKNRNYEGKRFSYKQPRQVPAEEPLPAVAAQSDIVPIGRAKRQKKVGAVRPRRRKASGE